MNKTIYFAGLLLASVVLTACDRPAETEQATAAVAEVADDHSVGTIDADGNVAPFGMASRQPVPVPEAESAPPAAAEVSAVYAAQCIACHGMDAKGVPGLGLDLVDSKLVDSSSNAELVAFLQEGRPADSPDTVTGVPMPAFAWMDEADLDEVVVYIRGL